MRKIILWKLCKKLRVYHISKLYMHKLEPIQENGTYKLLWNFELQIGLLTSTPRPDLVLINNLKILAVSWILPFRWTREGN